jgi:hypothetical protein
VASFQTFGSSRIRLTSASRVFFASKSKIPPQFGGARLEILQAPLDAVDAFRFHG